MARSVVLKTSERCLCCQLPPRWCICADVSPIESPLQVDVLSHHREETRPSSTGHLIQRALRSARGHLYRPERSLAREEILQPGKTLWILHPLGEPMPAAMPSPASLQVLLLDGSWRQASGMLRAVAPWGRPVSLPLAGRSRYWLRSQQGEGQFSTVEALLFLLGVLGLGAVHAGLQRSFELHVHAHLCARGRKQEAADYLAESPWREALEKRASHRAGK